VGAARASAALLASPAVLGVDVRPYRIARRKYKYRSHHSHGARRSATSRWSLTARLHPATVGSACGTGRLRGVGDSKLVGLEV